VGVDFFSILLIVWCSMEYVLKVRIV